MEIMVNINEDKYSKIGELTKKYLSEQMFMFYLYFHKYEHFGHLTNV